MAGQRQKPRAELAFKRAGRDRVIEATPPELQAYEIAMPAGLSPEAEFVWQETIPLASRHLVPTDFNHVRRWIWWVNAFVAAAAAMAEAGPVAAGRYGPILNPWARWLQQCEMNVQRLEASIGLNPQARMRHGITFAKEQTALDRLKGRAGDTAKPMAFPSAKG